MPFDDKPNKSITDYAEEAKKITKRLFLLMAPPGVGKTFSLTTIPKDDTLIYLDFDGKGDMLQPLFDSGQALRMDLVYSFDNYQEVYSKLKDILKGLQGEFKGKFIWGAIDSFTTLYALLDSFQTKNKRKANWDDMDWIDKELS